MNASSLSVALVATSAMTAGFLLPSPATPTRPGDSGGQTVAGQTVAGGSVIQGPDGPLIAKPDGVSLPTIPTVPAELEVRDPRLALPGRLPMDTVRMMERAKWVAGGHQLGGVMVNAAQDLIDDATAAGHLRTVVAEPVPQEQQRAAVLGRTFSHTPRSIYHWTLEVVDYRTEDDGTAVVKVRSQPCIMAGWRQACVFGDRPMEIWTIRPDGTVSVEHRDTYQEPEQLNGYRVLTVG